MKLTPKWFGAATRDYRYEFAFFYAPGRIFRIAITITVYQGSPLDRLLRQPPN